LTLPEHQLIHSSKKTDMVAAEERRLAAKAEEAKAAESGKSSEGPKKN
jgi:hypothetical protein